MVTNSFLGQLFAKDKSYAVGLSIVLFCYALVHLAKLEVFPLYMFAMYSLPENPKTSYATYVVTNNRQRLDLTHLDYRAYTYLHNTLQQYDGIINTGNTHPECQVLDKFIDRLFLKGTELGRSIKKPCSYDRDELDHSLEQWIGEFLKIENPKISILKESHAYKASSTYVTNTIEYELGK